MTLTTYISSTIIAFLPLGFLIPETFYKCGSSEIGGIYSPESRNIYVCEGDSHTKFYSTHEIGHKVWFEELSEEDKIAYTKFYDEALKKGLRAFSREYSMTNVEEDFSDNFALMVLKEKSKPEVNKRISKIRIIVRKTFK